MFNLVYLIPIFPLAGTAVNALICWYLAIRAASGRPPATDLKRFRQVSGIIACLMVFLSFVISAVLFFNYLKLPEGHEAVHVDPAYTWITAGGLNVDFLFRVDSLSLVMMLVVSGVGFVIHVYSTGYMHDDPDASRYFTYLNLFAFSMLLLVLGNNFLLMFIGWELVGLCSYLLIGFWYTKKSAADAGKKAFIVNRVGDFGFILAAILIYINFHTLNFDMVFSMAPEVLALGGFTVTAITMLLFMGATGKSAQIPLYVWLPDAMEGPTPVSALIHAATMVTAGVYMIARCSSLFVLAPDTLLLVAVIGLLTAIFAASIGLVQNDIKRVLAYSTISQLGYMFLACGVGAFTAGIFHLMTHAFFKALLFLGAGSVIHALSGEQDLRHMGGLRKHIPKTYWTFLIATLAITGFPPLSGFFSKDEIIWKSFSQGTFGTLFWVLAAITAGMTAFYMFRLFFLTFFGQSRVSEEAKAHLHESPPSMTTPLIILAVLALIGGWVGIPEVLGGHNLFHHFLEPAIAHYPAPDASALAAPEGGHHHSAALELGLMCGCMAMALAGLLLAWLFYIKKPGLPAQLSEKASGMYRTLLNKYYVDEIYDATLVNPIRRFSEKLWTVFDCIFIDGTVNGIAWITRFFSRRGTRLQSGYTQSYIILILIGAVLIIWYCLF